MFLPPDHHSGFGCLPKHVGQPPYPYFSPLNHIHIFFLCCVFYLQPQLLFLLTWCFASGLLLPLHGLILVMCNNGIVPMVTILVRFSPHSPPFASFLSCSPITRENHRILNWITVSQYPGPAGNCSSWGRYFVEVPASKPKVIMIQTSCSGVLWLTIHLVALLLSDPYYLDASCSASGHL